MNDPIEVDLQLRILGYIYEPVKDEKVLNKFDDSLKSAKLQVFFYGSGSKTFHGEKATAMKGVLDELAG